MRIFHGFDALPVFRHSTAAVGSFDGVHGGHKLLLDRAVTQARLSGGESIVFTFEPHPRVTLGCADGMRLLTSTEEKAWLLERAGVDNLVVIPFDLAFSRLAPDVFVRDYLIGKAGVKTLIVGYNHRFGHGKAGDYEYLERLREAFGFRVIRIPEYDIEAGKVSSTVLRRLIERGELEHAARMMLHPYVVIGESIGGAIRIAEPLKLLPPAGTYPVQANGRRARLILDAHGGMRIEEAEAISPIEATSGSRREGVCGTYEIGQQGDATIREHPTDGAQNSIKGWTHLPDGKVIITF